MSFNPLLNDPSIIQVNTPDGRTASNDPIQDTLPSSSLEPGNALAKLLDSAIAKAAKETTPDLGPRSHSNSPSINSMTSQTKNPHLTYSIEFLLSLRNSPLVENYKDSAKLPDKEFWNQKPLKASEYERGGKSKNHKKNLSYNKRNHQNETWERKPAKANDIDQLSSDKISQLLGETGDEVEPEWDSADLGGNESLIMGGQTVEDFERWKHQMKIQDSKRNGEEIPIEESAGNAGNDVDSFFSFITPKATKPAEKGSNSDSSTESATPKTTATEVSSKSSRFSSFFNAPTREPSHQVETQTPQPPQIHNKEPIQAQGFSRFFAGPSEPTNIPKPAPPPPEQFQSFAPPGARQGTSISSDSEPGIVNNSKTEDSFFMSLLNRRDGSAPSTPKAKPNESAFFSQNNNLNTQNVQNSPQQGKEQHQPQSHPGQTQALQQVQVPPQGPQGPQGQAQHPQHPQSIQGPPQNLPPWMKQFPNGVPQYPNMPPNGPPRHIQGHTGHPQGPQGHNQGQAPQGQPGQPIPGPQGNPAQQGIPGQGPPPPPGMFPNGFVPPPGQPMPPQFNGRNQFMGPGGPQFMGFPPGMPPPPHLQGQPQYHPQMQQQFQQQHLQHLQQLQQRQRQGQNQNQTR